MRTLLILIGVFLITISYAQSSYQIGALPAFNLNRSLPKDFKLNFKIESRQLFKEGVFGTESNFEFQPLLYDFTLIGAKKIDINKSLALGYLFRLREGEVVQRAIQQFILTRNYAAFKLAHRFSTDQTFLKSKKIAFRLRYRFTTQVPLSGEKVDPKEFYIKINNEYLGEWGDDSFVAEIRVVPLLGYEFTDNKKIELGLDYRISSFLKNNSSQRFWISLTWYQSI